MDCTECYCWLAFLNTQIISLLTTLSFKSINCKKKDLIHVGYSIKKKTKNQTRKH